MKARIYKPARNAMQQSGQGNNSHWRLEFLPEAPLFVDPLMGWTGMTDMAQEVKLHFQTREEAMEYAERNGIAYEFSTPEAREIKPKSYAANFAFDRIRDVRESQ